MADSGESSKETSGVSVAMTDRDFDVNTELMANGMDDEATLEEEETLEEGEGFNAGELDDLHKDAEVPLADILALYYNPDNNERQEDEDNDEEQSELNDHVPLDSIQPEPLPPLSHYEHEVTQNGLDISPNDSPLPQDGLESQNTINPPENQRITRGLAAAYQYFPDSDSTSSDEDYSPIEDWKKEIQIGPEHQAEVPDSVCPVDDPEHEHKSKCLWSPKGIVEQELQKYLSSVCGQSNWDSDTSSGKGDDEQALYVLLQCNYNYEEAMKKFKSQPPPSEEMTFWSEEECRNFELGLRTCGKDFYSIQQTKIPARTVGDIVQFYYLWKKTERHDAFSFQLRPNKKKYSFHPGITDYMDRFLDENESAASSRASSPHSSVFRPQTAQSSFPAEDVNHVIIDKPPVTTPASSAANATNLIRIPQAYVPTPVIVTNDKEPPAKKPNFGLPVSHLLSNGPPPLRLVTTTTPAATTTDYQIPRLHTAGPSMYIPSQLTTAIHHHSSPMTTTNTLGYLPLNNRPTHHPHLNIHAMDTSGSYAQLTQNS